MEFSDKTDEIDILLEHNKIYNIITNLINTPDDEDYVLEKVYALVLRLKKRIMHKADALLELITSATAKKHFKNKNLLQGLDDNGATSLAG